MTADFHHRYYDEWWTPITADWEQKTGKTPSGLDGATANTDWQQLTGSTASPFPAITPVPAPTPAPTPTAADLTMAAAAHTWLTAKNL
jgi:hypothetical protein